MRMLYWPAAAATAAVDVLSAVYFYYLQLLLLLRYRKSTYEFETPSHYRVHPASDFHYAWYCCILLLVLRSHAGIFFCVFVEYFE